MPDSIKKDGKFYICAAPQAADLLQTGFEALTWVEIGRVLTLPDMGVTENIVSQDYINTDVSQKQKGFANAGDGELVVGYDPTDLGQIAIDTAGETKFNYAFKLELSDAPDALTTNTVIYSRGVVSPWMLRV